MPIQITNISKRYLNNWILKDISFEVAEGEILGIFGATGEGKSVLMRILAGTEKSNGGAILYNSRDVSDYSCERRGFHFPKLNNDSFWSSIFGSRKASELADGEGQLLALEKALEEAKGVLLLDNSFCDMDRRNREESYVKLRQAVKENNLTVIFASNDYEEVFLACDKVAVLSSGEIRQFGTPHEVYSEPASRAVASLMGRNNLIEARRLTSTKFEVPEFQTITGEHRLVARRTEKNSLGAINQNVYLAIRPEYISISFGASFPEDNLLRAKIADVRFQGATTLVELDANGLILEALVLRLVGLNVGDECMVGLPPDRLQVLKD